MDRFDAMALFISVIDNGGFSAAARARGLPVATVSRRIADLEASLGAQLLNRTTRVVTLTAAGTAYAESARRIIASLEAAERSASGVQGAVEGELVVSSPGLISRLYILPIALAFMEAHPEVQVTLRTTDLALDLVEERIDVALRIGHLPDSTLVATKLGDVRLLACCAPSLLEKYPAPTGPEDFSRLPHIAMRTMTSAMIRSVDVDKLGDLRTLHRDQFKVLVDDSSEAVDAAIEGAGVALMTYFHVAHAIDSGELVLLLEEGAPPPVPVHLIHPPGPAPLKTRRFIEFAAPRLRRLLASFPKVGDPPRPVDPN